jgi:hypothetical protein
MINGNARCPPLVLVVPQRSLGVRKLQIEIAEAGMSRTVDQIRSTVQTLVESLPGIAPAKGDSAAVV